jgi:hypothetical protein
MEQQTNWLDKDSIKFFLSFMTVVIMLGVSNLGYTFTHENIHAQICRTYGGTPIFDYSKIYIKSTTTCNGSSDSDDMKVLNSWVEIIGYHFQVAMNIWLGWKGCDIFIRRIEKE